MRRTDIEPILSKSLTNYGLLKNYEYHEGPLNLIEASIVFYYLMVDRYWDIVTDTFIEYENWIVCTF